MKKVFILPEKACDHRCLDAQRISEYLKKNGYKIVDNPKESDIIVFMPCAAFTVVAKKALEEVKKLKKYNAELIVAGCLPEIDREELKQIFDGKTITTLDIRNHPEKMDQLFPGNKVKFRDVKDANTLYRNFDKNKYRDSLKEITKDTVFLNITTYLKSFVLGKLMGKNSHFYMRAMENWPTYHVRVAWGCLGDCYYCTIKNAIGRLRSKPLNQCIAEFKKAVDEGHKKIIITADDTGVYGLDIGSSLPELLNKIVDIPGDYKIFIRNVNPRMLVKYSDELNKIAESKKIEFLECPLDSFSSRILKLMNRYSETDKIKEALIELKQHDPDVKIFTHLITGFPSETEEEFKKGLRLIKDAEIHAGFVFPFSCRKGTKADKMDNKLSSDTMAKRMYFAREYLKKYGYNIIFQNEKYPMSFSRKY